MAEDFTLSVFGFEVFYFFSVEPGDFLLRMYIAAPKITMMAKTTAGRAHPELVPGAVAVEFVAIGAVVAVVAVVALVTGRMYRYINELGPIMYKALPGWEIKPVHLFAQ